MIATSITNLRDNLKDYFDKSVDSFEPIIVTRKGENMVILPQTIYDGLIETSYLLSEEENRLHLKRSIEQYNNSKCTPHNLMGEIDD